MPVAYILATTLVTALLAPLYTAVLVAWALASWV